MKIGATLNHKEATYVLAEGKCVYCRDGVQLETWTIDHVIPKSVGGLDAIRNWVCCCSECNGAKSDYLPRQLAAAVRAAKKLQQKCDADGTWGPSNKRRCCEVWVSPKGIWLFKKKFSDVYKQKFADQIEREKSRRRKAARRLRHLLRSRLSVRVRLDGTNIACVVIKSPT